MFYCGLFLLVYTLLKKNRDIIVVFFKGDDLFGQDLCFWTSKTYTDAVTSAIVLSYLKNKLGMDTEPRVLGDLNNETAFVLDYFKLETPKYLNDVHLQIKDVDYLKDCLFARK